MKIHSYIQRKMIVGLFDPKAVVPLCPFRATPISVRFFVINTCSGYDPGHILMVDPAGTEFTAWVMVG